MSRGDFILQNLWPGVLANLKSHGGLVPTAFFDTKRGLVIAGIDENFLRDELMRNALGVVLREQVKRLEATAVVVVMRSWHCKLDPVSLAIQRAGGVIPLAENQPNRQESVSVIVQEPGRCDIGYRPVTRDEHGCPSISAEPPELQHVDGTVNFFEEPK